jgi:chaperonin cofactor prefoldin
MAEVTKGSKSRVSTVAGTALILAVFCAVYVLMYMPTVKDNTEATVEQFTKIDQQLSRLEIRISALEKRLADLGSDTITTGEILSLRQALVSLEMVAEKLGDSRRMDAEAARTELQNLLNIIERMSAPSE